MRLLAAIDEGRHNLDGLKKRVGSEVLPSTRTLRRYLTILADAGFPWYYDRQAGVYRFESGHSLRKLELSGSEMLGLTALRGIANSLGGNIGASIDGVTQKLAGVADRRSVAASEKPAVLLQFADIQLDASRSAIFELVQRAQRDRQSIRFDYLDKRARPSERHVDPYGFVVSNGRVYVIAHDRGRGAIRVFAIDRVAKPRFASQRYVIPPEFEIEEFAARSVSGTMHADVATRVTVRFAPVVAAAARADRVVREREIVERPDGSVDITYVVADPAEIVRWSLRWGAEAEIVAPPTVRDQVRTIVLALANRYAATNTEGP